MLLISSAIPAVGNVNIFKSSMDKQNSCDPISIDWWPMFHHDPQNSGFSTSTSPDTDNVLWKNDIGSAIISSPAVVDGKLYFGSYDHNIYCLNANNSSQIWMHSTGDVVVNSPAVAYGNVYISSWDHNFYCLYAINGSLKWNFSAEDYFDSPTVAYGNIYVCSCSRNLSNLVGYLHCLNATDGSINWEFPVITEGDFCPAVANDKVYVADPINYKFYCINAFTGKEEWNISTNGPILSDPTVAHGNIYINVLEQNKSLFNNFNRADRSYYLNAPYNLEHNNFFSGDDNRVGRLYCLNASYGYEIWNTTCFLWNSCPAVAYGKVFVSHYGAQILCYDAFNGSLEWNFPTQSSIYCSPTVADGKVFVGVGFGPFYCINATDGSLIWEYITGDHIESTPAVVNGIVYFGGYDGFMYAFSEPNEPPNKPNIDGPTSGNAGTKYYYNFTINDIDGDPMFLWVDWDDGTQGPYTGPYESGIVNLGHTWSEKGNYTIKAKAKDVHGDESEWGYLEVTMPINHQANSWWFLQFLQDHPRMFPILRQLLGL